MQRLRITAQLMTGQVATYDRYLPLDSMLAWSWMRENHPELMQVSQSSIHPDSLVEPDLPLEKRGQGDDWYWACSFACGEVKREEILHWHKRFDQAEAEAYVDFGKRRGAVDTHSGHYKGYRMPLVVTLAPKIAWYAVGDLGGVLDLAHRIKFIGKKRAQGYGAVARWTVEPWDEDLSHLRAVPDPEGPLDIGIRPPYWLPNHMRRAKLPDDRRLLCSGR
jgi:CRISPR type IV-associated protein Csf3